MRKSDTSAWKAKSTRNRHNGRINADTARLLAVGKTFAMSDGKVYSAVISKVALPPNPNDPLEVGEDGVIAAKRVFKTNTRSVHNRSFESLDTKGNKSL